MPSRPTKPVRDKIKHRPVLQPAEPPSLTKQPPSIMGGAGWLYKPQPNRRHPQLASDAPTVGLQLALDTSPNLSCASLRSARVARLTYPDDSAPWNSLWAHEGPETSARRYLRAHEEPVPAQRRRPKMSAHARHAACCKSSILYFLPSPGRKSVAEDRFYTVDRGLRCRCCAGESSPSGKTPPIAVRLDNLPRSCGAKSHDCNGFFVPSLPKSQNRTFAAPSERHSREH